MASLECNPSLTTDSAKVSISAEPLLAFGLFWLLAAEPIRRVHLEGPITVLCGIVGVLILPGLIVLLISKYRSVGAQLPVLGFALFVVYSIMALAFGSAGVTHEGIQNVSVYAISAVLLCAGMLASNSRMSDFAAFSDLWLHRYIYCAVCGSVPYILLEFVTSSASRDTGTGAAPGVALIGFIACASLEKRRGSDWAAGAVLVGGLLLSVSRFYAAFALIVLIVGFARSRGAKHHELRRMVLRASIAIPFAVAAALSSSAFMSRFSDNDSVSVAGLDLGTSGRSKIWSTLIDRINGASVLLGHGPGAAANLVARQFITVTQPHNDYIRFAYDFGLPIAALFTLSVLAMCVRNGLFVRRARIRNDGSAPVYAMAFLGLMFILACALVDNISIYVFVVAPVYGWVGLSLRLSDEQQVTRTTSSSGGPSGHMQRRNVSAVRVIASSRPYGGIDRHFLHAPSSDSAERRAPATREVHRRARATRSRVR